MTTNESLISISKFIAGYSAHLMGAGVHTSRAVSYTHLTLPTIYSV